MSRLLPLLFGNYMYKLFAAIVILILSQPCFAQEIPHVDQLIKSLDTNQDGSLSKKETAASARYASKFSRWDTNKDGEVSKSEIVGYRARFGIAADGSRVRPEARRPAKRRNKVPSDIASLSIPDMDTVKRVGRGTPLEPSKRRQSEYILATAPHQVDGQAYFIITDHKESGYLDSLKKLQRHHGGKMIVVQDLAALHQSQDKLAAVRKQLDGAKFVAIAPTMKSFRENTVLGLWELLTTLDSDPELDVFPGFLIASNEQAFERLIEQSIQHRPLAANQVQPMAINQVVSSRETRSLQKSGILRKHFRRAKLETPIVAIYGRNAADAPKLDGEKTWNLEAGTAKSRFVREFSDPIERELASANLIVMHGHGIPGMSCSVDVDALPDDFTGKFLLSGSCFSASPTESDIAAMNQAPGGYKVTKRDAFIVRAIDNGAVAAFGHQRLSSGFPHLYPVLESWTEGQTIGQSYQELINGLIQLQEIKSGQFIMSESQRGQRSPPQQRLLYVLIGDPALQPFERLTFTD